MDEKIPILYFKITRTMGINGEAIDHAGSLCAEINRNVGKTYDIVIDNNYR